MTAADKTDRYAKKGLIVRRVHKEEAIFDTELQRYVMLSERVIMPKQK
jgi:hypothetical protein